MQMQPENSVINEKDIYTSLDSAKEEIRQRWKNTDLRKKVDSFLSGRIPEAFKDGPRSVLFRQIMSPDIEFSHFIELSAQANIEPLGFEYFDDKFCTSNTDKLGQAKMAFYNGKNKNGDVIVKHRTIVDCNNCNNTNYVDMRTLWGEGFIEFHHRILALKATNFKYVDYSAWFHSHGKHASEYYRYFLSLFLCHGILFENFVTDQSEAKFADSVVLPAVSELEREFGLKPLIVPLAPPDEAADKYWWCYPAHIEEEVLRCLKPSI
jgi:hypothetical protein